MAASKWHLPTRHVAERRRSLKFRMFARLREKVTRLAHLRKANAVAIATVYDVL